jgi:hypothetical protein
MVESQSRYGIMQELNNRKVNEKEKLANLEREKDNHVFEEDKKIMSIEEQIRNEEATYKIKYKDRERQRTVNLQMITSDFQRMKKELEEAMKEDKETYESKFVAWKQSNLDKVKVAREELKRYEEVQARKIKDKEAVIVEIENGIASLKEMSKEQKE